METGLNKPANSKHWTFVVLIWFSPNGTLTKVMEVGTMSDRAAICILAKCPFSLRAPTRLPPLRQSSLCASKLATKYRIQTWKALEGSRNSKFSKRTKRPACEFNSRIATCFHLLCNGTQLGRLSPPLHVGVAHPPPCGVLPAVPSVLQWFWSLTSPMRSIFILRCTFDTSIYGIHIHHGFWGASPLRNMGFDP